jgi:cell division protein FtsI (penicillin-binding protein 3)
VERQLRSQVRNRILGITGCLVLVSALIIGRLFSLQVTGHQRLSARAEEQLTEEIQFLPKRGIIADRAGRRLAVDVEVDSVYGVPSQVADKRQVASKLASLTGKDPARYAKELAKKRPFVWLERRVSPAVAAQITAMGWKGVGFIKENRRFYPQREFGAQVLGVAGMDNQGLAGLELAYDADLWREAVVVMAEQDAFGHDILVSGPPLEALREGDELRLTIDEVVQFIAQEELGRGVESAGAAGGSIVVLEPRTGDVLAMANVPFFNPNEPAACTQAAMRNRAIGDALEPGSIMKTFLLSAALEERVVTRETTFFCENGAMPFQGGTLHDVHPYGTLSVNDVIGKSSNIGSTKIALRLGAANYYRYLKAFGFGEKTGVDLPGEAIGMLRPVARWSGRSIASVAIGQEVSVTPLQMAAAFAAAVNGGQLMRPRVARELVSPEGKVLKRFEPQKVRQVISPETSRLVVETLVHVVEEGTGKSAAVEGYAVGGKTGTAQKYDAALKTYSGHKYLASFVGVAPARDPRLVVLVMVDEPKGAIYGGSVAAPIFKRVVQRTLRYLNVPPETEEQVLLVQNFPGATP